MFASYGNVVLKKVLMDVDGVHQKIWPTQSTHTPQVASRK